MNTIPIEFSVRETNGKLAFMDDIARNEVWASGLMADDMEGFAITESGELILLDECGNYRYAPSERFDVTIRIQIMEAARGIGWQSREDER